MPADLDTAKYVSFTTFKRDGAPVATAVWLVPFEGGYAFTTDADSFKVRRLRNNPAVTVAVCDIRGRVAPGATVHHGTGEVLEGEAYRRVESAIKRRYWLAWNLMLAPMNLLRRLGGKSAAASTAVKFVVD